jgi:NAD(P)-dependent dehydrogenase (short-subunit alcohol dehydrogenase family)
MTAKAAFITGGASGIGLAVAQHFAAQGWRVGLADVNAAGLEAVKAALPEATTHVMDVRDPAQWQAALADFATASGGRLDFLFNNAGIGLGGPLAEATVEEIDRILGVNLSGVIYGARAAYPLLKATPDSAMLITSSAAGISGTADLSLYCATKFAVRGLAESLYGEWAPDGIFVGTIMPSFIETAILDNVVPGSNRNVREAVRSAGLEITPVSEVASAVWQIVNARRAVHSRVGKTAHRMWFMARWFPRALRKLSSKPLK